MQFSTDHYCLGDDGGTEWYEEPITIVGFVAGFLLLVLVIASILILCHSREEDEEEESEGNSATSRDNHGHEGSSDEYEKTNPLYIAANEFDLRPLPTPIRAKFVHIHVDESRVTREGFESYYNTGRRCSDP